MTRILTIEDDENIRQLIVFNLESEGYEVMACEDGESGLKAVFNWKPDMILLDLMLPIMDGYEIIKRLQKEDNETPVIMLTAKNDEVDKIVGLEFGADDYMTKPFSVRELKARIKAVLRRFEKTAAKTDSHNTSDDSGLTDKDIININDLKINIPAREVNVKDKVVPLSMKEFDLLLMLAENRGRVLTRSQLLDSIWGYEYVGETRTVDVHIRFLRKKLASEENRYIETVRGVGYKMV